MPEIGSVCSGGRYNELASLYTTRKLPGVGAAIGLDRLLAALDALGRSKSGQKDPKVLVANQDTELLSQFHAAASSLRGHAISAEVFPETKKLMVQYGYAEKKGIPFALLIDRESLAAGTFPLRELARRSTTVFECLEELVAFLGGLPE